MELLLGAAAAFLAYANGANDNFKGVATLYGGHVSTYRKALLLGTLATFAGSLAAVVLGQKLLKLFSGQGIVAGGLVSDPVFLVCVALSAGFVVILATFLGFPISTTHGLIGGIAGAGIAAGGLQSWSVLGSRFLVPLVAGPVAAILITYVLYQGLTAARKAFRVEANQCLCIGEQQEVLIGAPGLLTIRSSGLRVTVEEEQHCRTVYSGTVAGINVQKLMDVLHMISAAGVSFARGLNDTPKIAALFLLMPFLGKGSAMLGVGIGMAVGGLIHSRRIAARMSFDITDMNPGQAFTGNLVTAAMVTAGSLLGLPLSTTHVSCGSIFGIGLANRNARLRTIAGILSAWVITLPLSAVISALLWRALR